MQIHTLASTASKQSLAIAIKAGLNELRFRAVQNPDNALSIAVDRMTLSPAP